MNARFLIASLALIIGLLLGWVLVKQPPVEDVAVAETKVVKKHTLTPVAPNPKSERRPAQASDRAPEFDPNAIPYERVISFKNEEDYRRFLNRLSQSNLRRLGQIDRLRAVRLGFTSLLDFDGLGLDPDELQFNFPVTVPDLPEISPQSGLVGFGPSALSFLGITSDNSDWGAGVKIAVIDTGIEPHLALRDNVQRINLVDSVPGAEVNSHGTSVASLIAGNHPQMRGVVPEADLIAVKVVDENGSSSSFILAEGIIAAADAGAHLINISLGSTGNSPLVRRAVEYATESGSLIFASSGNDGASSSAFPGADPNVYSVGAVDALGQYVNFSNSDNDLSLTAPGYEVRAAVAGDNVTSFTGTSASAPFVTGAVAAIMTQSDPPVSARVAIDLLIDYANEAGVAGADPEYGNGIINIGRVLQRNTPGITDLAIASQTFLFPDAEANTSGLSGLQVAVENRGTEPVFQSTVEIDISGDRFTSSIQAIQPNEVRVITIPAGGQELQREGQLSVEAEINLPDGSRDLIPANDQRTEMITLPENDN